MKVQHNNRLKVLQVNGEQFGFHDFTRNNEDLTLNEVYSIQNLNVGESVYIGITEVKRVN